MWAGSSRRVSLYRLERGDSLLESISERLGNDGHEKVRLIIQSLFGDSEITLEQRVNATVFAEPFARNAKLFEELMRLPRDHQIALIRYFGGFDDDSAEAYFRVLRSAGSPKPEVLWANAGNLNQVLRPVGGGIVTDYYDRHPLTPDMFSRLKEETEFVDRPFSPHSLTILLLLQAIYGERTFIAFLDRLHDEKAHFSTLTSVKILENWDKTLTQPLAWAAEIYGE